MKKFWSIVLSVAAKVALYAADHPDQVIAIANAAKNIK